jgi:hypothetical protein
MQNSLFSKPILRRPSAPRASMMLACAWFAGASLVDLRQADAQSTDPGATAQPALDKQAIVLLQKTAKALESGTVDPAEEPDFRALLAIGETLKTDKTLVAAERIRLEALIRIRLRHAAEAINRQAAREARAKGSRHKTAPRLPDAPPVAILAQVPAAGQGAAAQGFAGGIGVPQAGGTEQEAQKLIDLIQAVIAPESWDVNGGQGVIRYWALGHGLVIRNSASEHERTGDLLEQLR